MKRQTCVLGLKDVRVTGYPADAMDRASFLEADTSMMQKPFAIDALSNTIGKLLVG